jgi:hypothetical protein
MTCVPYRVYPSDCGGWTLDLESRVAGPYATRNLALQVAMAEAAHLRAANWPVCIIVNDARGEVTASRCICTAFDQHLQARSF